MRDKQPPPGLDVTAKLLKALVAVPKKEIDAALARERRRKLAGARPGASAPPETVIF